MIWDTRSFHKLIFGAKPIQSMDSLTQIVLGAAVGETVLGKKAGNKAMIYGAIAGTIPDLDTFASSFVDVVSAVEIHRGFTHSLVFALLFGPILGWGISKIERRSGIGWKDWSKLVFWAFLTHALLDSLTTWGTQLFWPLDLRLDFRTIFVIDPLYTLPFLTFLILAMCSKRGSEKRERFNRLGLLISSCYLLLCVCLKGLAYQKFKSALEEGGIAYLQLETRPSPMNNILWMAHVELQDAYLIGDYSFFDSAPISFGRYQKNHHLLGELDSRDKIRRLIGIANGWYIITGRDGNLFFNDLRFGLLNADAEAPEFVFSYRIVEEAGEIEIEEVERNPREAKKLLRELGKRILGN